MNDDSISLNKFISSTGMCSRREADRMIESGRVLLNHKTAKKGNRVLPGDEVIVDGSKIKSKRKNDIYLAFNKPPGITCTTDLSDRDNIIDYINYPKRIFPIGRLDKPSTGLILLTNDGDIVNQILREENNHDKEYIVTIDRPVTPQFIRKMSGGIPMLGEVTKKCQVNKLGSHRFSIILTQGLNRQIRRMCEYLDTRVVTLKRIRIMNIHIDNLPVGSHRHLTKVELAELRKQL